MLSEIGGLFRRSLFLYGIGKKYVVLRIWVVHQGDVQRINVRVQLGKGCERQPISVFYNKVEPLSFCEKVAAR